MDLPRLAFGACQHGDVRIHDPHFIEPVHFGRIKNKLSVITISSAAAAAIAVRFLLGKHGESGFIGFRFLA
jgi:hypothetical protein